MILLYQILFCTTLYKASNHTLTAMKQYYSLSDNKKIVEDLTYIDTIYMRDNIVVNDDEYMVYSNKKFIIDYMNVTHLLQINKNKVTENYIIRNNTDHHHPNPTWEF